MTDLTLTVSRTIKATPKRIYDAWLDPAMMTRFLSPRPDMHVREARSDAQVGGRFFVMMVGDRDLPHEGTYMELTPHSRLVFTSEAPWSAPGTTVTVRLTPNGDATEVELTQVRFTDPQSRDSHAEGWTGILAKLDAAVS
jgi:uncharacterized protein YndB with AHSA1/START domain